MEIFPPTIEGITNYVEHAVEVCRFGPFKVRIHKPSKLGLVLKGFLSFLKKSLVEETT